MYSKGSRDYFALFTLGGVFFILGFATWINAMLIPFLRVACQLTNLQSYLVTFAFYIAYLTMAVPVARLLKRTGLKSGIMIGLWVMSAGTFLFIPAALSRYYPLFLTALFVIGSGLAVLQTASNPYIVLLGDEKRAGQRLSIMGVCNKTAGIISPLLLATYIIMPADGRLFKLIPFMDEIHKKVILNEISRRVIEPYAIMGIVFILLGFIIRFSALPDINYAPATETPPATSVKKNLINHYPHLILGAIAIFFHVGSQIIAIDTIIPYAQGMGFSILSAKVFPSITLLFTIGGYLLGISLIPKVLLQHKALKICTVGGILLSVFVIISHGRVSVGHYEVPVTLLFLTSLGFANSMIWAGIWPLALHGLGERVTAGAAILVLGLCGNALVPLIYGYLADKFDLQTAYIVLLPCYAYLIFYAFYGYGVKHWRLRSRQIEN